MNSQEIQQKVTELQAILSQFRLELGNLEKELYQAITDYQEALKEERLKEIRQSLPS
jgi:DNA anti-recombination protein RmuC